MSKEDKPKEVSQREFDKAVKSLLNSPPMPKSGTQDDRRKSGRKKGKARD